MFWNLAELILYPFVKSSTASVKIVSALEPLDVYAGRLPGTHYPIRPGVWVTRSLRGPKLKLVGRFMRKSRIGGAQAPPKSHAPCASYAIKRAYKSAVHHASRNGPDNFAQMRFVVCAPPHSSLIGGPSVAAAVFIGIISVACGRRNAVKRAYRNAVQHARRIELNDFAQMRFVVCAPPHDSSEKAVASEDRRKAKTEAAIAAEKTDIVMPVGNKREWHRLDILIRMEIRPYFISTVRQLLSIMLV
uniref:Secreted protein n=1 Tax=Globodera pallida TaxID=36090 RepID=A0A183C6N3_GLOPA